MKKFCKSCAKRRAALKSASQSILSKIKAKGAILRLKHEVK
jgi:hypothetical protein